ncbi:uncharacterized protein LOC114742938 isoform X2 [Neltuma alba]|nr:uncharacterized protein LOC114742938 isoform X2 [Prosopis alba]
MHPMSTVSIQRPEFQNFFPNGCPSRDKCLRITASWTILNRAMGSKFHAMMNNKKEEVSVQLSTSSMLVAEILGCDNLHCDESQPSYQELAPDNMFEFGQFVAREAMLDEEYWTAAWLRAESHWEDRTYERYIDNYKRKFAEQEYNAVKRRCRGQTRESCTCIITVNNEQKNVKGSILKSVVGTLDLSIGYLLKGETFPGEGVKAPPLLFRSIDRTPPSRYGYIANLCVAKSARRVGIASNMLYFAVEYAKSHGAEQAYVHVDPNNRPAQILYQKMGFEMVEPAHDHLSPQQPYLLRLHI